MARNTKLPHSLFDVVFEHTKIKCMISVYKTSIVLLS
jgi:hypothetical protein